MTRSRVQFIHPLPKYFQIQSLLRERILRSEPGESRLPGEVALCREFGVSRFTVRQALAALEREKFIRREKGRGTFVARRLPRTTLKKRFTGLIEELINAGVATRAKLVHQALVPASAQVAARLRITPGGEVLEVERIWYVEERPFSHAYCYLPPEMARELAGDHLDASPIAILLHQRHRVPLVEIEQVIGGFLANAPTARLLKVPIGAPLLEIERIYISRNEQPVLYVHSFYRADRYQYAVKLVGPLRDHAPGRNS